jgi:hypothetical protein
VETFSHDRGQLVWGLGFCDSDDWKFLGERRHALTITKGNTANLPVIRSELNVRTATQIKAIHGFFDRRITNRWPRVSGFVEKAETVA